MRSFHSYDDKIVKESMRLMKITDCYPVFYTNDIEAQIKCISEDFGFEVKHRPQIKFLDYAIMENGKNRRIDIVCSHFPADHFKEGYFGMRVNVDDFDEGLSYFEEKGYSLFGEPHEVETSITGLLTREGGAYVILFHHKK